jgi:hypothetical protein
MLNFFSRIHLNTFLLYVAFLFAVCSMFFLQACITSSGFKFLKYITESFYGVSLGADAQNIIDLRVS